MKGAIRSVTFTMLAAMLVACSDQPAPTAWITSPSRSVQPVTHTHAEFDVHVDAYIYLTCINEVTHWVGTGHVTIDEIQTPTGITSIRVEGRSDESNFYLTRANGVRYDMFGQGSTERHEFIGPVHLLDIAEPKLFRSADGDVLVTNYHLMIRFDDQGNPISVTANGACP